MYKNYTDAKFAFSQGSNEFMEIMWEGDKKLKLFYARYLLEKYSTPSIMSFDVKTNGVISRESDSIKAINDLLKRGDLKRSGDGIHKLWTFEITKKGKIKKWYIEVVRMGLLRWLPISSFE